MSPGRLSPDGTMIAFDSDMEGGSHLFVMNADGTEVRRVTTSAGVNLFANWSGDGTHILYVSLQEPEDGEEELGDFYLVDLETMEAERLTDTPYLNVAPSCRGC